MLDIVLLASRHSKCRDGTQLLPRPFRGLHGRTAICGAGGGAEFLNSTCMNAWLLTSALPTLSFMRPPLLLPEAGRNIVFPPMAVSSRIPPDWCTQVDPA